MMENKKIDLELTITFSTPFFVGSGFGIAGLVDSRTIKDSDGIAYMPGSSIKGKIRSEYKKNLEALNAGSVCNSIVNHKTDICMQSDIKNVCAICRLFGSEIHEGSLIFEDAVMDNELENIISTIEKDGIIPEFQSSIRAGTKINRFLKTTEKGALFTFEGVNPAIIFISHIYGLCFITDEEYDYLKGTIETITHLGGNKSRGMGKCEINIKELES